MGASREERETVEERESGFSTETAGGCSHESGVFFLIIFIDLKGYCSNLVFHFCKIAGQETD